MKFFDAFSGIGGFHLGIKKANPNTECIGYSEIDKYAISVYERQFPNVANFGDIGKIDTNDLPDFDILVGGTPCQSWSISGERKGFEDARGTLFYDYARILRDKQPSYFVFENVKGLLNHANGHSFKRIISTFTELGYDCQWQLLNSRYHRVPQNRQRIFVIGHLRGRPRPEVFPFRYNDEQGEKSKEAVTTTSLIAVGTLRTHNDGKGFRQTKELLSPTIPARAREDGSGQPVIIAQRGRYNVDGKTEQQFEPRSDGVTNALTTVQKDNMLARAREDGSGQPTIIVKNHFNFQEKDMFTTIDASYYKGFDNHQQRSGIYDGISIRRLTPLECERLQSFPDNFTILGKNGAIISDAQRYKMIGNAVTVNVIQDIFSAFFRSLERA